MHAVGCRCLLSCEQVAQNYCVLVAHFDLQVIANISNMCCESREHRFHRIRRVETCRKTCMRMMLKIVRRVLERQEDVQRERERGGGEAKAHAIAKKYGKITIDIHNETHLPRQISCCYLVFFTYFLLTVDCFHYIIVVGWLAAIAIIIIILSAKRLALVASFISTWEIVTCHQSTR